MRPNVRASSLSALLAIAAIAITSCSATLEAPPVEINYRDSLVGIGKIIRITNSGADGLSALEVRIENPNGDVKNHPVASLAPGTTLELGWKKLDGFQVELGARVTVKAEGFVLPLKAELTASESD